MNAPRSRTRTSTCVATTTPSRATGWTTNCIPRPVIVGSETNPKKIAPNWELVREHAHVIGDFTWTGWDYLGGVRHRAGAATSWDLDPTASRRAHGPVARGSPRTPAISTSPAFAGRCCTGGRSCGVCVTLPAPRGAAARAPRRGVVVPGRAGRSPTLIVSWLWPGFEGKPITVEVYSDADEVEVAGER